MDSQDFQGWLSAAGGLTRAQRREALAVLSGRSAGEGVEGGDRARCGRGPALSALRAGGGGFARHGAGPAALPMQGLRQDLQRADRHPAVGPAPQGALAVVRGLACGRRDGEGVGGTVRCGGEHGVPLASPLSGGGAGWFGGAQGHRGSGRDLCAGEPQGCARAGAQGAAARRRSAVSRASRCRFSWRWTVAGRRSAQCCPGLTRRPSRPPSIRWSPGDALLVSDGGASYPPCAAALGVSHESLNRSMGGTGPGRSACADGKQPPQPLEGLPATSPRRRHPLSGQLSELVPPRRPRPRRQRSRLPCRRRDEITHTIR